MDQWDRLLSVECKRYQQAPTVISKSRPAASNDSVGRVSVVNSALVPSGNSNLLSRAPTELEYSVPPPLVLGAKKTVRAPQGGHRSQQQHQQQQLSAQTFRGSPRSARLAENGETEAALAHTAAAPALTVAGVESTIRGKQSNGSTRGYRVANSLHSAPELEGSEVPATPTAGAATTTWAAWLRRFHASSDPCRVLLTALQSDPDTWRKLVRRFTLSLRQSASTASSESTFIDPMDAQSTSWSYVSRGDDATARFESQHLRDADTWATLRNDQTSEREGDRRDWRARRAEGRFVSGCHSCASSTTADSGRYPPEPQGLFRSSRRSNGSTASSVLSSRRSSEVNRLWERAESLC